MTINSLFNSIFSSAGAAGANSNVQAKQEEVSAWEACISEKEEQAGTASEEKNYLDSESSTLQGDLQTSQNAVAAAQNNLSNAQNALSEAMNIPVKEIKNEDGTITLDSSERDEAIAKAREELEKAQAELEKAENENTQIQNKLDSLQDQIDKIQQSLDQINSEKANAKVSLDSAKKELEAAQKEAQEIEKQQTEQNNENNKTDESSNAGISNFLDIINPNKVFDKIKNTKDMNNKIKNSPEEVQTMVSDYTKVILNPDVYSESEINEAKNNLSFINKCTEKQKEDLDGYSELANKAAMLNDESKPEEIEEIKNKFHELNIQTNMKNGATKETAQAIEQAYKEIGITEDLDADGVGLDTGANLKYGGAPGDAWCASFVSWLYGEGQNRDNSDTFGYQIAVRYLRADAQKANYYSSAENYEPSAGDIMIQENNASHTGIVVKTDDEYVYTIEGNANEAVRARKYKKDGERYKTISGYIRMNEWTGGTASHKSVDFLPDEKYEDVDLQKQNKLT